MDGWMEEEDGIEDSNTEKKISRSMTRGSVNVKIQPSVPNHTSEEA